MNTPQVNLDDLNRVVDAVLIKLYGSGNLVNGFSATSILQANQMSLDPGFVEIVVDKLKDLPYWKFHEVTSYSGSDLILNHSAAGYDFYREKGLYTEYLEIEDAKAKLLDKAIIDTARATVHASDYAKKSTRIATWSFVWAIFTTLITVYQFFAIQSNRDEIQKLNQELERQLLSKPSSRARPTEKQKTMKLASPVRQTK